MYEQGLRKGLKAEAAGARTTRGNRDLTVVHIGWWADGHILVQGRLLFIPSDAHARALGKSKVELSAEYAGSAGGRGLVEPLQWSPFLGDDHFDDEVVLDAHATLAVHVAKWVETNVAGSVELYIDLPTLKVGLPGCLDFLIGNGADVLVEYTLALTADL